MKADTNFRLICKTRSRLRQALNTKSKLSSTLDILGIDLDIYRKRIEFHFAPELKWTNIQIDQVKPNSSFDVSEDEELWGAFCWKFTQPLLKEIHSNEGKKFNFLDYHLQFIKRYQFLKINEKSSNEDIHQCDIQKTSRKIYPTNKKMYNHIDEKWSIDLADNIDYKNPDKKG